MIVRRAVGVLATKMQFIRGIVGGPIASLVSAIHPGKDPPVQRMTLRREADRVRVPIPPREGLNVARITQLRSQNGAIADPLPNLARERVEKGWDRAPRILRVERRVAARELTISRIEDVLAERDILARDIGLVLAAAIVETDNAAVGRRPLRPVDPSVTPER